MTTIVSKMTSNKRLVTATSKVLSISRRTLARRISTREQLETINPNQCWAIVCRCPRNDKVSNEWHDIVVNFWTENSRVSSNRRDVLTHRISRGVREEHQKHLLDISQTELFHKFQDAHRDITIGQRTFEAMKPWYIRPNKVWTHVVVGTMLSSIIIMKHFVIIGCSSNQQMKPLKCMPLIS